MQKGREATLVRATPGRITVSTWIGMSLNQFRLTAHLGEGSTGKVYRAEDRVLGRSIAVKIIAQAQTGGVEAFLREARLTASLEHPYITRLYQVGRWGSWLYIAMELVDGGHAGQLVDASGPLPLSRAAQLGAQAAEALAYAHGRGVVHCDVKPANLLLTRAGDCKLSDFGLARMIGRMEADEDAFGCVGTPLYCSPEMAQGLRPDPSADIYSLGATMWHLLTGAPPFPSGTTREVINQHIRARLPDLRTLRPDLPKPLATLITRSLAKNPVDRVSDASTFAAALKAYVTPVPQLIEVTSDVLPDLPDLRRARPRRPAVPRAVWLGAGVVCTVLTATCVWLVARPGPDAETSVAFIETTDALNLGNGISRLGPPILRFDASDRTGLTRVLASHDTRTYAVRGVVKRVVSSPTRKSIRIEFAGTGSNGFYCTGLSEVVTRFIPPEEGGKSELENRTVVVHGTLRDSPEGPRIIVRDLDQIAFPGGAP